MLLMPFAFENSKNNSKTLKRSDRHTMFKIKMFWNLRLQSDFKGIKNYQNITKQELPLKCHCNKLT